MTIEVRRVETTINETGVGKSDRVDVSYELGDEIEGVWVRFASVPQSQVEHAKQRAAVEAERNPQPEPEPAPEPHDPTRPVGEVAPDANVPASSASSTGEQQQ